MDCLRRTSIVAVTAGLAITGCGTSSRPRINDVVLKAAQVGPGYTLQERDDSHKLEGYVTLDLCGGRFPSEALRTARLQVNYTGAPPAIHVSNEVVSYRSGGPQQALRELDEVAARCPATPVTGPVAGEPPTTYRITPITGPDLAPAYRAYEIRASAVVGGRPQTYTGYAIYQARGEILSAVYTESTDGSDTRTLALHAAAEAAQNLAK